MSHHFQAKYTRERERRGKETESEREGWMNESCYTIPEEGSWRDKDSDRNRNRDRV